MLGENGPELMILKSNIIFEISMWFIALSAITKGLQCLGQSIQ